MSKPVSKPVHKPVNEPESSPVQLEVVSPGAYASLQDMGRRGFRRIGVPWAGVLDPRLMRIANALVGNTGDAPVVECFDGGLQLTARGGSVRLAVAGHAVLEVDRAGVHKKMPAWCSLTLHDGDSLRLRSLSQGRLAMVAVEGLALPQVLGSASTYARAGLGGLDGRNLVPGARLPVPAASARQDKTLPQPPSTSADPFHVVAGPQADHFSADSLAALASTDYRVSTEADRMGVRLEGPSLAHLAAKEIVSDATVPGSIQVPGNGQPIVLLADAQTAGGYPKIGTVVSADLPRLANSRPGELLRFVWVSAEEGEQLARAAETQTLALLAALRPWLDGGIDEAALYAGNLVSGVVDAMSFEYRLIDAIQGR